MKELANKTLNVGILVYPDVEIIDFSGPYETFSIANRVAKRDRDPDRELFKAFFVAEGSDVVRARYGFGVAPDYAMHDHPDIDILVVPGGIIDQPIRSTKSLDWIKAQAKTASVVTSVCTGAFLLAECGLLDGRKATTHWEDIPDLRNRYPSIDVVDRVWVDEGRLLTSAGIAAGIDMSLRIVARIHDDELADTAAKQMVYHRARNGEAREQLVAK